ncbi:MAG: uroporphyrinogen decarboxylase family protein, partial [Desulfobacterales bacterium]
MAKQALIDAYRGKRTDIPPWVPYAGVHCAFLINEPADKMLKDPELLAKGVVHTAKRYKADGIPLVFDLSVEANAVGCELKWWEDNVPSVKTHPCSDKSPADAGLKIPSKEDGRWPVLFEAARIAKPQLDELDCVLMGLFCGPLTLASHLAGVRIFTDVYKNPDFAAEVCKFAGEIGAKSAEFYAEMGCEIIANVDPVASQIKPETFRTYVTPNSQAANKVIKDAGYTSSFFICGDATKVMEEVCKVGTDGFAIDEQMNMNFIRDLAR